MPLKFKLSLVVAAAISLSACGVAKTTGKVATMPFKAAYKTGEVAAKGTYYTGKGVYKTGEFAGKTAIGVGKTVYKIGTVPVTVTDRALDTTSKVLTISTQAVDIAGKTAVYTKQIQAAQLDMELAKYKNAKNILSVFVDAVG